MRMNLILEILDVPGQLVSILNPIGELGANVVTIVHKREIKAEIMQTTQNDEAEISP